MTTRVSSWGRLESPEHQVVALIQIDQLPANSAGLALPFGSGRSYGDVCLNPDGVLWTTRSLDRFIAFDAEHGLLTCEAGVLLRDIQRMAIPRGWMLPVTPGTQVVTVGGAIANDIHGKNHHVRGSFGDHVQRIHLLRTDGQTIVCGPDQAVDWFKATVGGMGLTGVIAQATLQLRRIEGPWLEAENVPFKQLSEFFQLLMTPRPTGSIPCPGLIASTAKGEEYSCVGIMWLRRQGLVRLAVGSQCLCCHRFP